MKKKRSVGFYSTATLSINNNLCGEQAFLFFFGSNESRTHWHNSQTSPSQSFCTWKKSFARVAKCTK